MSSESIKAQMHEMAPEVPESVPVYRLTRFAPDELQNQAARMARSLSEQGEYQRGRNRWEKHNGRSLLLLAEGARLTVHHDSGAVVYKSGLPPAAEPFGIEKEQADLRSVAEKSVASVASRLPLDRWVGRHGRIEHERVWRIMGAGADRSGRTSAATMFRAVGAYRHLVDEIPVWGPASVALRVTGSGQVDSLATLIRRPDDDVIDKVPVAPIEQGVESLVGQMETLMGGSRASLDEVAKPHWVRFGYLSQGRRRAQRTLEPVYLTLVDIETEDSHGYLLATNASPKVFDPVHRAGQVSASVPSRQAVG